MKGDIKSEGVFERALKSHLDGIVGALTAEKQR
jgi:hypothetical protein